jgi:hypothetical protein
MKKGFQSVMALLLTTSVTATSGITVSAQENISDDIADTEFSASQEGTQINSDREIEQKIHNLYAENDSI